MNIYPTHGLDKDRLSRNNENNITEPKQCTCVQLSHTSLITHDRFRLMVSQSQDSQALAVREESWSNETAELWRSTQRLWELHREQ